MLQGTELINFDKRRKIATVIEEIQRYQQQQYALRAVPAIQVRITGARLVTDTPSGAAVI